MCAFSSAAEARRLSPPWCLPTFIVRVAGSCKLAIFISVLFLYVGLLLLLAWVQTGSRQHLLKQACLFFFFFLFVFLSFMRLRRFRLVGQCLPWLPFPGYSITHYCSNPSK